MTDYLARAMEQEENGERRETAAPELKAEEAPWGLLRRELDAEAGTGRTGNRGPDMGAKDRSLADDPAIEKLSRAMDGPGEESAIDRLAEALDREAEAGGMARRGRRALRGVRRQADALNEGVLERADEGGVDVSVVGRLGRALTGVPGGRAAERTVTDVPGVSVSGRAAEDALPLLAAVRRVQAGVDFARGQRRAFSVTLPEAPVPVSGWTAEELDRAVERDARRYDGGFPLY